MNHHLDGAAAQFRAQYVISAAADGVNFSTNKLGVNMVMEGHTKVVDSVKIHFKADLSDYLDSKSSLFPVWAILLTIAQTTLLSRIS